MLICKQPILSACLFSFVFVYDLCQMSSELRYGIYCRVCGKNLCSYRFFIILSNGDNFVFTKSLLHLATFCVLTQSCLTLCDLVDCNPPGSSLHGIFLAEVQKEMGCHFLLQRIFPTQGSNPGLPLCRQVLYHLSHQGSPICI